MAKNKYLNNEVENMDLKESMQPKEEPTNQAVNTIKLFRKDLENYSGVITTPFNSNDVIDSVNYTTLKIDKGIINVPTHMPNCIRNFEKDGFKRV